MNTPIVVEDLLEINPNYQITSFENDVIIIDNWYKNYEKLYEVLVNMPVQRWKWTPGSRNFIDYYDCRGYLPLYMQNDPRISSYFDEYCYIIEHFFHIQYSNMSLKTKTQGLEFNFFKVIKENVAENFQHHPHRDGNCFNCIIYLDKISSGGTAVYDYIESYKTNEINDLLYDTANINKFIIPSKPNRLVIFNGNRFHGGYIENYNLYRENFRINQVIFCEVIPKENNEGLNYN